VREDCLSTGWIPPPDAPAIEAIEPRRRNEEKERGEGAARRSEEKERGEGAARRSEERGAEARRGRALVGACERARRALFSVGGVLRRDINLFPIFYSVSQS
jgi:hypothetical protein